MSGRVWARMRCLFGHDWEVTKEVWPKTPPGYKWLVRRVCLRCGLVDDQIERKNSTERDRLARAIDRQARAREIEAGK